MCFNFILFRYVNAVWTYPRLWCTTTVSISEIPILAMDLYCTYVSWQIICWKSNFENFFSFFKYCVKSQDDSWKEDFIDISLISRRQLDDLLSCSIFYISLHNWLGSRRKAFIIVKSKIGEWEYNWCYDLQKNRFHSPNNHLNSLLGTMKRLIVKEGKVANSRMIKSELKSFFNLLLFGQRLIKRFPLFATQDQCDLIIVINYSRWLNMKLITINTENIENWKIAGWHTMKV